MESTESVSPNEKPRLNMTHGFIKFIKHNQVDRDNYDKEVKATESGEKIPKVIVASGGLSKRKLNFKDNQEDPDYWRNRKLKTEEKKEPEDPDYWRNRKSLGFATREKRPKVDRGHGMFRSLIKTVDPKGVVIDAEESIAQKVLRRNKGRRATSLYQPNTLKGATETVLRTTNRISKNPLRLNVHQGIFHSVLQNIDGVSARRPPVATGSGLALNRKCLKQTLTKNLMKNKNFVFKSMAQVGLIREKPETKVVEEEVEEPQELFSRSYRKESTMFGLRSLKMRSTIETSATVSPKSKRRNPNQKNFIKAILHDHLRQQG